jgi:hypothetical protein
MSLENRKTGILCEESKAYKSLVALTLSDYKENARKGMKR